MEFALCSMFLFVATASSLAQQRLENSILDVEQRNKSSAKNIYKTVVSLSDGNSTASCYPVIVVGRQYLQNLGAMHLLAIAFSRNRSKCQIVDAQHNTEQAFSTVQTSPLYST